MRYLAIDLGGKRTGLAVGDDVTRIVTPLEVVSAGDDATRLRGIDRAIDQHGPDALLLGLPLNMNGTEGPAAQGVRRFGEALARHTALPVAYHDERLTSDAADAAMSRSGLTHGGKKARRDALAAAVILQDYFERTRTGSQ